MLNMHGTLDSGSETLSGLAAVNDGAQNGQGLRRQSRGDEKGCGARSDSYHDWARLVSTSPAVSERKSKCLWTNRNMIRAGRLRQR